MKKGVNMKIYTQDRKAIIELPREVWATKNGNKGALVVGTSYIAQYIGEYASLDRAKEIVREIFEYYRKGKNSYIMPEQ